MKRIWKINKDKEAVSPVIATILMVAITVVLAAVLYVMVIGFGGGGATAPPGTMTALTPTSQWNATLTFGSFEPAPEPMEIRIILSSTALEITYSFSSQPTASPFIMTASTGGAEYTDYNVAGNQINSGDFLKVTGLTPNTQYTIKVFHIQSNDMCALTGTTSFATPP